MESSTLTEPHWSEPVEKKNTWKNYLQNLNNVGEYILKWGVDV